MLMVGGICSITILRFSSSSCFTLGSTQCERTSMMEFNLEKLKSALYRVQFCYLQTSPKILFGAGSKT